MKRILIVFAILLFSSQSFAQKIQKAVIQTTIDCTHCKECETCGQLFAKSMYKISGLKTFTLDADKAELTVYFNPKKTDLLSIKQSVAKLGYRADDIPAEPAAYEALDACCKK